MKISAILYKVYDVGIQETTFLLRVCRDASLLVTVGSRQCLDMIVGKIENGFIERGFVKHRLNCLLITDPLFLLIKPIVLWRCRCRCRRRCLSSLIIHEERAGIAVFDFVVHISGYAPKGLFLQTLQEQNCVLLPETE